jgi:putative endonuclease
MTKGCLLVLHPGTPAQKMDGRNGKCYILVAMKRHEYCVYILTNKANTVFYTGVTSDLMGRVSEHKLKIYKGFSSNYECNKLVYYEEYQWIHDAIAREKQIKAGSRKKKINLIIADNPSWSDLSDGWYD